MSNNVIDAFKNVLVDQYDWVTDLAAFEDTAEPTRVLLIDDDPIFCKKAQQVAKQKHLALTTCGSVAEMGKLPGHLPYDVALVDYYLGDTTAPKVVPFFRDELPVVLISESQAKDLTNQDWPNPIKSFVPKANGLNAILDEASRVAHPLHAQAVPKALDPSTLEWSGYVFWITYIAFAIAAAGIITWLSSTAKFHTTGLDIPTPTKSILTLPPVKFDLHPPLMWDAAPVRKSFDVG